MIPVCKDKLKIIDSGRAVTQAVDLKKEAGRPSGPPLLLAFNLCTYFRTNSGVKQTDDNKCGDWLGFALELIIPLSVVNTLVKYLFNKSAFSALSVCRFPFESRRGAIPFEPLSFLLTYL
jgi:hypothetical protein